MFEDLPLTTHLHLAGIGEGTRWYDWYTLEEVSAGPHENVTLSAPIEHINVHARGGAIFTLQTPAYTTEETKNNPYSLLVALDDNESATGMVYLDDGVSLVPNATKIVQYTYSDGCLRSSIEGSYQESAALANITIVGLKSEPSIYCVGYASSQCQDAQLDTQFSNGVLRISGMEQSTQGGAFAEVLELRLS